MSDGELQKQIEKKAFLVAQEPYGKIESGFKEVKLKDVLEVVVAMKRDFLECFPMGFEPFSKEEFDEVLMNGDKSAMLYMLESLKKLCRTWFGSAEE